MAALVSGLSEIGMESLGSDSVATESETKYSPLPPGQSRAHFTDRLINKVVGKISAAQEREKLKSKLNDTRRAEQPRLSVTQLAVNFKSLSYRLNGFFDFQKQVISVLSWDSTWKTISFLLLYTWGCMYPFMFLVYPLVVVCCGILIPNYVDKHPLGKPSIIPERQRGAESVFGFLKVTKSDVESYYEDTRLSEVREQMFEQTLRDEGYFGEDLSTGLSSAASSDTEDASGAIYGTIADARTKLLVDGLVGVSGERKEGGDEGGNDDTGSSVGPENPSFVDNLSLLINMRDLQNVTTNLLKSMDKFEKLVNRYCSFRDERLSTLLFFEMIGLIAVTCVLGPYIPWSTIFALAGWYGVLWNHPGRAKFLEQFKTEEKDNGIPKRESIPKRIMTKELIIDEPTRYRDVAIFEIEEQDITNPSAYRAFAYSTSCFTVSSSRREQRKKPVGTTDLKTVRAPSREWRFRNESGWRVDKDVEAWCAEVNVEDEVYVEGEWAYDLTREYRRRRLVREVFRRGSS
ncbi:DEKNAAC102043 [Brettanomyces naardenensis]|uniref:DEKNAAC102043 n=1 Tax=Brettanomyces naardenensis TaxID=13370 RepID=A0A448YJV1_BRENA|nr:DEKNAAC102043 [Brettanomyces naardenensis]